MVQELLSPPKPPSPFVGRQSELEWLEREVYSRERLFPQMPLVIVGPAGVGKTSLVAEFVSRLSERTSRLSERKRAVWFECAKFDKDGAAFSLLMDGEIREQRSREIVAILDGADEVPQEHFTRIFRGVLNFKAVRSVIVTSRTELNLRGERVLRLGELPKEDSKRLIHELAGAEIAALTVDQMMGAAQGLPLALILISSLARTLTPEQLSRVLKGNLYDLKEQAPAEQQTLITIARPIIISANERMIAALKKHPDDVFRLSPRQFEELIAELIHDMGHDVTLTKATRDGGKDILASIETEMGKFLCLVEAKHYRSDRKVGVSLVRELYGTLCDFQANSAMLVTTSSFSKDAHDLQEKHKYQLSLKGYTDVAKWIQKYGTDKKSGIGN